MAIDQSQTCKLTFGLLNLQFSFAANVAVLIIVVVGPDDVDVGVGDGVVVKQFEQRNCILPLLI